MLYGALEQAPSAEIVEEEVLQRYFARFDESFFTYCDKELAKINTFYAEKIAEATRKFAMLKSELEGPESENLVKKKKIQKRKMTDMKLAFSEFYLSLILLQNYQNLTLTKLKTKNPIRPGVQFLCQRMVASLLNRLRTKLLNKTSSSVFNLHTGLFTIT